MAKKDDSQKQKKESDGITITISDKAKEQIKNLKAPDEVIENIAKQLRKHY